MTRKLKLEELNRADLDTYRASDKHNVVLVLDNIRSALNVGSAFRSGDAFAIKKLYLTGITPAPPHRDITKSAIGATLSVDYESVDSVETCLHMLKHEGYQIIGLEQTSASEELTRFKWPEAFAIVVGNEVNGISDKALPIIDRFVEIPQFGTKHSLNVSVATGIVLWDWIKQTLDTDAS